MSALIQRAKGVVWLKCSMSGQVGQRGTSLLVERPACLAWDSLASASVCCLASPGGARASFASPGAELFQSRQCGAKPLLRGAGVPGPGLVQAGLLALLA
mmetsp:Transcript_70797/g.160146  ORF Transcript_70797/g.160146 Transcript_70797/m.160146 type:complete len:100 (+) Transcript_70797:87-386(+)